MNGKHLMKSFVWFSLLILSLVVPARVTFGQETNHDIAKWKKEISTNERSDATNPPPTGACLFTGSSYILHLNAAGYKLLTTAVKSQWPH